MGRVIIFLGPSASGKSTTETAFVDNGWAKRIIQQCTRAKRENEIDGVHYHFCTPEEFHKKLCINIIEINPEWLYGIDPLLLDNIKQDDTDYIYSVINGVYAENIIKVLQWKEIPFVFVLFDIPKDVRIDLLKSRGEIPSDIQLRLDREDDYTNYNYLVPPDCIISELTPDLVNDLNTCLNG